MMPTNLAARSCKPCETGAPALKGEELTQYQNGLNSAWRVVDDRRLERDFKFTNFLEALAFTNKVGELAETEGHHPDIFLTWGKVRLTLWTHSSGGLTENDFIMAAKVDALPQA